MKAFSMYASFVCNVLIASKLIKDARDLITVYVFCKYKSEQDSRSSLTVLWEGRLENFDEMMAVSMASDVRFVNECKAVKVSSVMITFWRERYLSVLGSIRM